LNPIEYFVVNLPEALTNEPKELVNSLLSSSSIEIYENLTIQTIINFKWQKYTKQFFQMQFYIFLVFVFSLIGDILISLELTENETKIWDDLFTNYNCALVFCLKFVCLGILSYFSKHEITSASRDVRAYFSDFWNYIDFLLIGLYIIGCI